MRMIEADKVPPLIRLLLMNNKYAEAIVRDVKAIIDRHTIEAEPVQHGWWELYSTTMQECSLCKKHTPRHRYLYCPNCGAKMDKGE